MSAQQVEHVEVLVIGAGISGIAAAHQLLTQRPGTSFTILEGGSASGGTWDLFRYPGIRSDSDLHTYGYEFKPWTDSKAIAGADRILAYLRETATEYGIDRHIRYRHRVLDAAWSSEESRWTVTVERTDTGEEIVLTAGWLFAATGYYDYAQGYTPHFEGRDHYRGTIVHPQQWPEDLDYTGKSVVVIGSGATAVTLVPTMAEGGARHVTMLQRTPTYIMRVPAEDRLANLLPKILGAKLGYAATRRKNIVRQRLTYTFFRHYPKAARKLIRAMNARALPKGFDVDTHFNPPYDPWDQRLCVVPDGDLFRTISEGRASVVTDRIRTFTENGVLLESGEELTADVVVTATGLNVRFFGGIAVSVDGKPLNPSDHVAYKGTMLSGVPNLTFVIGYNSASWTLRVGLIVEHFRRLLGHMHEHGHNVCVPVAPEMETRPLLDLASGYVQRSGNQLPRQGSEFPWRMPKDHIDDARLVLGAPVVNEQLHFSSVRPRDRVSA
ncbi:flavin-containing monooxygenase [Streptomyces sp. A30]|uniref:flavin-containing monooxygenase n=1 Tax=Streptomyces sp. A30 TaxID=2789273 RepID=UPI00398085C2